MRNSGGLAPWNYVLEVPVASARIAGYAMKGDAFQLSARLGDGQIDIKPVSDIRIGFKTYSVGGK